MKDLNAVVDPLVYPSFDGLGLPPETDTDISELLETQVAPLDAQVDPTDILGAMEALGGDTESGLSFDHDDLSFLEGALAGASGPGPALGGSDTLPGQLNSMAPMISLSVDPMTFTLAAPSDDGSGPSSLQSCGCPLCGGSSGTPGGEAGNGDDAPGAPASIQTLANYLTTGYWTDTGRSARWFNMTNSGTGANGETLYYNIDGWSGTRSGYSDSNGVSNTQHRLMIQDAFDFYGELLGITFIQTTSDADHVDFFFGDFDGTRAFNSSTLHSGTGGAIDYNVINVANGWGNGSGGTYNGYVYQTYLHEIGHGLGLGHQGNYNAGVGTPTYDNSAVWQNDSWALSIMSYWSQTANTSGSTPYSYAELISMAPADLLALNALYASMGNGVANAFNGNTVYGVGTTVTSNYQISLLANFANQNAFTIVDGDGIDTVDFSNFAANQTIDLTVASSTSTLGTVSSVGGLVGNMSLAVGTVIENAVTGAGNDTLIGNQYNNTLSGNAGNDYIYGGDGIDDLFGGDGIDVLYAGEGSFNYLYSGGDDGDTDYAFGGGGNDRVYGGTGAFYAYGYGGDEYMYGGGGSDFFYGGANSDRLYGSSGNDTLEAGEGQDTVFGGADNDTIIDLESITLDTSLDDTYDGGDGIDTLIHDRTWVSTVHFNLAAGYTYWNGVAHDRLISIENLTVGGAAQVTGDGASNTISFTGTYDNNVNAGSGQDTVYSGGGNDVITDTESIATDTTYDDTYDGGDGTDTLVHDLDWVSSVHFNLAAGYTYWNGVAHDRLISIENLTIGGNAKVTGSDVSNVITANGSGANLIKAGAGNDTVYGGGGEDRLYGGGGSDQLEGGGGNDVIYSDGGADAIYGGGGIDTVNYAASIAGVTISLTAGTGSGGHAAGDTLFGIENVIGTAAADDLSGSSASNSLYGGKGVDRLDGRAGDDVLEGGGSADELIGGSGSDTASYARSNAAVTVSLSSGTGTGGHAAGDTLTSIENLIGSGFADSLSGSSGDNTLRGKDGNDVLDGRSGADVLDGGGGKDTLTGGGGADLFVFKVDSDRDTVTDFQDGSDLVDLIGLAFSDLTLSSIAGGVRAAITDTPTIWINLMGVDLADVTSDDFT